MIEKRHTKILMYKPLVNVIGRYYRSFNFFFK